jgi:hypothetical protein
VSAPDRWRRQPLPAGTERPRALSRDEPWTTGALRGLVLLLAAFVALTLAVTWAYSGWVPVQVVTAQMIVAPIGLVCWVLAATRGGDRWTAGFLSFVALEVAVVTLRHVVVSVV